MATTFKEDDFLCERCGYILNGLGPEADCPECGKPAWESHPGRRVGTRWFQRLRPKEVSRAFWAFVLRPSSIFAIEPVGKRHSLAHIILFSFAAGFLYSGSLDSIQPHIFEADSSAVDFMMPFMTFIVAALLFLGLIAIEYAGIRFFGNKNKWRITGSHALTICAVSSPGWVIGLVAGVLPVLLVIALDEGHLWIRNGTLSIYNPVNLMLVIIPFVFGLLWFETLVYIGMRRMKYANPPEAAPVWSVEEARRARGELAAPSDDMPRSSPSPPAGETTSAGADNG
jgi:hypothetical protein